MPLIKQIFPTGTDEFFDNKRKSKLPFCFWKENVDEVITKLDNILS
jgi:hypothetical protein